VLEAQQAREMAQRRVSRQDQLARVASYAWRQASASLACAARCSSSSAACTA
jgi:hypothetical protein